MSVATRYRHRDFPSINLLGCFGIWPALAGLRGSPQCAARRTRRLPYPVRERTGPTHQYSDRRALNGTVISIEGEDLKPRLTGDGLAAIMAENNGLVMQLVMSRKDERERIVSPEARRGVQFYGGAQPCISSGTRPIGSGHARTIGVAPCWEQAAPQVVPAATSRQASSPAVYCKAELPHGTRLVPRSLHTCEQSGARCRSSRSIFRNRAGRPADLWNISAWQTRERFKLPQEEALAAWDGTHLIYDAVAALGSNADGLQ